MAWTSVYLVEPRNPRSTGVSLSIFFSGHETRGKGAGLRA